MNPATPTVELKWSGKSDSILSEFSRTGERGWDAEGTRSDFKRKEGMRGDATVRETAARHGINPNQLSRWKTEA